MSHTKTSVKKRDLYSCSVASIGFVVTEKQYGKCEKSSFCSLTIMGEIFKIFLVNNQSINEINMKVNVGFHI
jgi:hypothetical protein